MHRIGTLPGSFNDFVLLVKGVPAPIEVALELETPNVGQNVSPACQKPKGSRLLGFDRGTGSRLWTAKAATFCLHAARERDSGLDGFQPRWGGKFVIKVIRR